MKIVYGVCSWGLGHATRSLPVIRALINEGHVLTIVSHDRALTLLQQEIGDYATYADIQDYPMLISENGRQFLAKSAVYWPLFIHRIEQGLGHLKTILNKEHYHLIISDSRYDMYSRKTPSMFISHQMRIMNPMRIRMLERGSERFNQFFFNRFTDVIVPDTKTNSLSGDLSHNLKLLNEDAIHYVGPLSDFHKKRLVKNIDYLVSLSGPEPQRTILETKIMDQLSSLDGSIVLTQGKPETAEKTKQDNITVYTSVSRQTRENLLNKAKIVIGRSGYTTIMDLAVTGTKALLIPTPGQIEQEYLATYHSKAGTFATVTQPRINLTDDLTRVKKTTGVKNTPSVTKTVDNILEVISNRVPQA
jgi:uncharacterized protein (TIGR00661 family)